MEKYAALIRELTELCRGRRAALWFSGGKDSLLLLHTIHLLRLPVTVVRMDTAWDRRQKRAVNDVLERYGVETYSWRPVTGSILGQDGSLALASSYTVGPRGEMHTVVQDIVDGPACGLEIRIDLAERPHAPLLFDLHITGSKRGETHWVLGDAVNIPGAAWKRGTVEFRAPLYEFTDEEVLLQLKRLNVPYTAPEEGEDTGNVPACTLCFHGERVVCPKTGEEIEPVLWDPKKRLTEWQTAMGVL